MIYRLLFCTTFFLCTAFSKEHDKSGQIYFAQFGDTQFYFYHSAEKEKITRDLIYSLNHNHFMLTTKERKILPVASKYSPLIKHVLDDDTEIHDSLGRMIYPDPIGNAVLNEYGSQLARLTEKELHLKVECLSRYLALNVNQDALTIQPENFHEQIVFLNGLSATHTPYLLFEEIALADWEMAPGTFSAFMIQDEESKDRWLLPVGPQEICLIASLTPIIAKSRVGIPPLQTIIPPMDYSSSRSSGSWKGKSLHAMIKGIVPASDIDSLAQGATPLPLNRPVISANSPHLHTYTYPNGIVIKELDTQPPIIPIGGCIKHDDKESLTILESSPGHSQFLPILKELFGLKGELKSVFHLIKQDSGFSELKSVFAAIPSDSEVLIINRSHLPTGHNHYAISEFCTDSPLPWIHLYLLPPDRIMKVSAEMLTHLALIPVEEILFQNESCKQEQLISNMNIQLDFLIFSYNL